MGRIFEQSARNTLTTFLGFAVGGINTLFLYTNFLEEAEYGLTTFVLSSSAVLMPLTAFGMQNALVKFYSGYYDGDEKDRFLNLVLVVPLAIILLMFLLASLFHGAIAGVIAQRNPVVTDYVYHIVLTGAAMAYFEIFYAWAKVHLKTVFGNFLREVSIRVATLILLFLVHWGVIGPEAFIHWLVGMYVLRTLVMMGYAFSLKRPEPTRALVGNHREIFTYSGFILLGGSIAILFLEIDKVMINQYEAIQKVAHYAVATYIATVIAIPSRAMHQITYPLTAETLNQGDRSMLRTLYGKSSLNLLIASGFLFLAVTLNLEDLYLLIPEGYRDGFWIVFIIGAAKVYDSSLGNINSILFYSEHYRALINLGILLAAMTIGLNMWFIPQFGPEGAAVATFIAIVSYNSLKLWVVWRRFGMQPYSRASAKTVLLVISAGALLFALPLGYIRWSIYPYVLFCCLHFTARAFISATFPRT